MKTQKLISRIEKLLIPLIAAGSLTYASPSGNPAKDLFSSTVRIGERYSRESVVREGYNETLSECFRLPLKLGNGEVISVKACASYFEGVPSHLEIKKPGISCLYEDVGGNLEEFQGGAYASCQDLLEQAVKSIKEDKRERASNS